MRFIFTGRRSSFPRAKKRKIKTFNAFFITHCHCPPLATPPTPPTPPSAMRSVAPSVCSADPGATLFVQATCLNKSHHPLTFLSFSFSFSCCCACFPRGVSPLSQRNRVCAAWKFDKLPCDFDFIAVLAQNSFLFLFAMANFWFGHFLLRFLRLRLRLDSLLPPHPLLVFFIYFYVFII